MSEMKTARNGVEKRYFLTELIGARAYCQGKKIGKLTDVIVTHRAALIMLKLVSEKGGEALANTQWSVLTPGGDVIKESIGAFPKVVLSEGEYRAIAKNEGKVYERPFNVVNGVDGEVEVVAR